MACPWREGKSIQLARVCSIIEQLWFGVSYRLLQTDRNMVLDSLLINNLYYFPSFGWMDANEEPNPQAADFFRMLKAAEEPLWDGCTTDSKLSYIADFLNNKSRIQMSEFGYNLITDLIKRSMPNGDRLAANYYEAKKMMKPLGLGYDKIDMCPKIGRASCRERV